MSSDQVRRARAVITAVAVAAVMLVPAVSAPAAVAAAPAATIVEYPVGEPVVWTSAEYAAPDLPTSAGVVRIELGAVPQVPSITCTLEDFAEPGEISATVPWSPDVTVEIEGGWWFAEDWFHITCVGRGDHTEFSYVWFPSATGAGASTVTVTRDELRGESSGRRFGVVSADDRARVRAGDTVRLVAPPGTWCAADFWDVLLHASWGDEWNWVESFDATRSADGGTLQFVLDPEQLDSPAFYGGYSLIETRHWGGSCAAEASFSHLIAIERAPRPESVKVAVSSKTAISLRPVKAIVLVSSTIDPSPDGRVEVFVDGRPVAAATLREAWLGRWTFTLPRLPRGTHSVEARYHPPDGGGTVLLGPPASVRVLI